MKYLLLLIVYISTSLGLEYDKSDSIKFLSKKNINIDELKRYYNFSIDRDLKNMILKKGVESKFNISDIKSLDLNLSRLSNYESLLYLASLELKDESYFTALQILQILSSNYNMRYIDEDISDIAILSAIKSKKNGNYREGLISSNYGFDISSSMISSYKFGENNVILYNFRNDFRKLLNNN